jgi:valyl-tRNA synthetase
MLFFKESILSFVSESFFFSKTIIFSAAFRIKKTDFIIPLTNLIDIEKDKLKLEEELKYAKGFLQSVIKKLNNKNFLKNAPEKIIDFEKKKLSDTKLKIDSLKKSMNDLS